jgi:hypothetical protein
MSALALLVFAIGAIGASPVAIYRCPGSDGVVLFSDRPCADGHLQAVQPVITLDMAHFSADETATLERLKDTGKGAASKVRSNRANVKSGDDRRCVAAQERLDRVYATKRRGYRASSAAALNAREREYEKQRDRECGR